MNGVPHALETSRTAGTTIGACWGTGCPWRHTAHGEDSHKQVRQAWLDAHPGETLPGGADPYASAR